MLKQFKNFILDILFPIECISCNKEGNFLCDNCFLEIELNKSQDCPKCHKKTDLGNFCDECKNTSRMKGVIVAATYENDLLQKAIHALKYKYILDMAKPLAKILKFGLNKTLFKGSKTMKAGFPPLSKLRRVNRKPACDRDNFRKIKKDWLIIPIPLHKKKLRERGFNQAELLGNELTKSLGLDCCNDAVARIKYTKSQMKLNPIYRRKNIKGAFKCVRPDKIKDKKIILVDDVCTTSATLEECAKAIYDFKPEEIWGLVLARGK